MNNLKKIGLTALAASLVSTSVFAGELAVTGAASMKAAHVTTATGANTGKSFTMGNNIYFKGSGELDNGLNVAVNFELDDGSNGAAASTSVWDNHSVTVSSDALGSFTFHGHGGASAQGAVSDTTGQTWDYQGTNEGNIDSSQGNNIMVYTLPSMVDGISVSASYVPKGTAAAQWSSATDFAIAYTGVEGLTAGYAIGEKNTTEATVGDVDTFYAKYAYGPVTVAYTETEFASKADASDREFTAYSVAYTVSDNISVHYGVSENTQNSVASSSTNKPEEVTGLVASYTMGGMTISGAMIDIKNQGFVENTKEEAWELGLSFAF